MASDSILIVTKYVIITKYIIKTKYITCGMNYSA